MFLAHCVGARARLHPGRVFSGVFAMGFVCPQLKFAYGLLWDALAGAGTAGKAERFGYAVRVVEEWVRASDAPVPRHRHGRTASGHGRARTGGAGGAGGAAAAGVTLSHTEWTHGFGQRGCCPAGTAQTDGCLLVGHRLQCSDPRTTWAGTGSWTDDTRAFGGVGGGGVVWVRRLAEGHSLVLQAVALLRNASRAPSSAKAKTARWEQWVVDGAEALLHLQRDDGSWGRAYPRANATSGSPPADADPLLDKADTLFPVYFLADAASFYASLPGAASADRAERYLAAAARGGEFAWATYGRAGLYAAGDYVPSNDKEAALYALRAYMALAEAAPPGGRGSPPGLWLERAAATAMFADTFHYQVDVPLAVDRPRGPPYSRYNDWARDWYEGQSTVGLGFIELGHSGVDTTGSEFVPELLRLYERTGDATVLNQALIQLHNTKQMLDVDGRKGYAEPGFMPELFIMATQAYDDPGGNGSPPRNYNRGIGKSVCGAAGLPVLRPTPSAASTPPPPPPPPPPHTHTHTHTHTPPSAARERPAHPLLPPAWGVQKTCAIARLRLYEAAS